MATTRQLQIGTHSGTFHADESLACFLLQQTAEFRHAAIVRTRNPEVLATLDVLVDVGGEYDPARRRFDHHQREFNETFDAQHSTRLSSAGLVYKHYGQQVLANTIQAFAESGPVAGDASALDTLYHRVYDDFIEAFDAVDNGIPMYPETLADGAKLKAAYSDHTSLAKRVGRLNPSWNSPDVNDEAAINKRFEQAVALVGTEFTSAVEYLVKSWFPAKQLVRKALQDRTGVHSSGRIIEFTVFCPWKEHLLLLEDELGIPNEQKPVYAIFRDTSGMWRVQAVPVGPSTFANRLGLPSAWRGLRDDALKSASQIPEACFVHAGGFIGGVATRDGALRMALAALELGGTPTFG